MQQSLTEITEALEQNWENLKNMVRDESGITDISYTTWVSPLTFYEFKDNTVFIHIHSDNNIALSYIDNHYKNFFKVTISEFLNEEVEIKFILNKDAINKEEIDVFLELSCFFDDPADIGNLVSGKQVKFNNHIL